MRNEIKDFLDKLSIMYPIDGNNERKLSLLNMYVEVLLEEAMRKNKNYDFDKMFIYIQKHYQYKQFPSIPYLLSLLDKAEVIEIELTGDEGKTIKRKLNGVEYEFTIVPNHWSGVKTISELDTEIEAKTKKNI